jgi:hypothetical protein
MKKYLPVVFFFLFFAGVAVVGTHWKQIGTVLYFADDITGAVFGNISSTGTVSGSLTDIGNTKGGVPFEDYTNWDTASHHAFGSTGIDGHELGETACQASIDNDNTKYKIATCDYHIDGTHYAFDAISGIDPNFLPGQNSAYIALLPYGLGTGRPTPFDAITSTGPTPYSAAQKLSLVPIARFNTPSGSTGPGSTIKLVRTDRFFITPYGYDDRIYHEEAIGALYVDGGNLFSNNTALIIGQRAGVLYDSRKVRHILAAFNTITAIFVHYSSNGEFAEERKRFIVDNVQCGNGTNDGLENMLPNRWCNNKILKSPKGTNGVQEGGLFYIYGAQSYGTQIGAEAEEFSFGLFINEFTSGLTPVAEIVIETGSDTPVIIDRRKCIVCVKSIN